MGLVEHIHPSLAEADYKKMSVKLKFIAASLLTFTALFIATAIVSQMFRTYRNLLQKEKIFWNLAVVRGVYGIFCIIVGIWAIFVDTELDKDVVYGTTPTSYVATTVTVGFFFFECSALSFSDYYYKQFNLMLSVHHWICLVGYSALMYVESSHFFGTRGLILEMSTPFSCLCWTLLKADKAHTLLWKTNQFLLVHTFHLRSVVECYLWYHTYIHWDRIWSDMPAIVFVMFYTQLVLVTLIMTPYWTLKKTKQMINPVDWNFEDSKKDTPIKIE